MNDNPSGETMLARSRGVGRMVDETLPRIRSTSGSYLHLQMRIYQRYYKRLVKVSYHKEDGSFNMHFYNFDNVFLVPAPDTIRRRAQERFHHQREIYWKQAAKKLGWLDYTDEEWRETDEAKATFEELAKGDIYLPTAKTMRKRKVLQEEYRKEFGIQTSLG